jgi:hypothetical protein
MAFSLAAVADDRATRRVEGLEFSRVLVIGDARVEIRQQEQYELRISGDPRDLDEEPFFLGREDVLVLGRNRSGRSFDDLRYRVGMPSLERVGVKGSGTVYVRPFDLASDEESAEFRVDGSGEIRLYGLKGPAAELVVEGSGAMKVVELELEELDAVVSGSGDLYVKNLRVDTAKFTVTGSGDLEVTEGGSVRRLEVNVVGSGDARLDDVDSENAEVNVVGSGSASIGAVGLHLEASILGSGDIRYRGEPKIERTVFGSGDIRARN